MDEQNMVYPYNGTLSSYKKEWSTDTCYSMDKPWKLQAQWMKPDAKGHIFYDSTLMKCPE